MIVLTAIIAASSLWQALTVRRQAALLQEVEDRRTRPSAHVVVSGLSDSRATDGYYYETTEYEGFSITNTGVIEITVTGWCLQRGVEPDGNTTMRASQPPLADVSDLRLPRRLQYGDTARVLFERRRLLMALTRDRDGRVARVRPEFQDSLGNTYSTAEWVEWTETGGVSHGGPEPGYLTPEAKRLALDRRNRRPLWRRL